MVFFKIRQPFTQRKRPIDIGNYRGCSENIEHTEKRCDNCTSRLPDHLSGDQYIEFGKLCMGVFKNVVMLLPSFHFHKLNVN